MISRPEEEIFLAWYDDPGFASAFVSSTGSISKATPVSHQKTASTKDIQKKLAPAAKQLKAPAINEDKDTPYQLPQNKQTEILPISQICPLLFPHILPLQCSRNGLSRIEDNKSISLVMEASALVTEAVKINKRLDQCYKRKFGPKKGKSWTPFFLITPHEDVLEMNSNLSELQNPKSKKPKN